MGDLVYWVANAILPDNAGVLLGCGELAAFFKEPPPTPRIRPVNGGCALAKWGLSLVLRAPQVMAALKKMANLQLGIGYKRGIELAIHLTRAYMEHGLALLSMDISNAFNEVRRWAMFREVNELCPCLNPYAEAFYRTQSLCFYWVEGEPVVIRSAEGSRMGCLLGCILFVIAIHTAFCDYAQHSRVSDMGGKTLAIVDDVGTP